MCAILVGGMDRLNKEYIIAAEKFGIKLKIFTGHENSIKRLLGAPDIIIICTGKISHSARTEAVKYATANSIPVEMIHSPGVSSLRRCISHIRQA